MGSFVFFAVLLGLIAAAFAVSALWQSSRKLAMVLALALPLCAAGLYYLRGTPQALDPANREAPKTMEAAVAMLQHRLADNPDSIEDRVVLARAYMAQEKFDLARKHYEIAVKQVPDDADLGVELAEALMRSRADRGFPPAAVALLQRAMESNPNNQRALFFLGAHHLQSGQPAEAAALWERLLPMLEPAAAGALHVQIDAARSAAGLPPLPEAVAADALLAVSIEIEPALAKLVERGDVLFVYATPADGQGPPVAAKRVAIGPWPIAVTLSDADSPMPTGKLSAQSSVVLRARLSKSGQASASSGDLEADPVLIELKAGAATTTLKLTRTVP